MAPKKDKGKKDAPKDAKAEAAKAGAAKAGAAKEAGPRIPECCPPVIFYPLLTLFGLAAIGGAVLVFLQYKKVIEDNKDYKEEVKALRIAIAEWISNKELETKTDDAISQLTHIEDLIEAELQFYDRHRIEYARGYLDKNRVRFWQPYGKDTYYFSRRKKNWYEAERYCVVRDAHLASIINYEEQDFITSQLLEPAWIGLSKQNAIGTWEWTDNSAFTTQYWPNEKSKSEHKEGMEEDCVTIGPTVSTYNWRHANCYKLNRWVCKRNQEVDKS